MRHVTEAIRPLLPILAPVAALSALLALFVGPLWLLARAAGLPL